MLRYAVALIGLVLLAATSVPASAKPAKCFTTDDGYYNCDFRAVGADGSFRISAPSYPTYVLEISSPGFAYGHVIISGSTAFLPGQYVRQRDDPACWANPETSTKICAW